MIKTKRKKKKKINFWIYLKRLPVSEKLAAYALIFTIIFGFWGIRLTYQVMGTPVDVQNFSTLLHKTQELNEKQAKMILDNQQIIKSSSEQVQSLILINKNISEQLAILSNQQQISKSMAVYSKKADEAKFRAAVQNLVTYNRDYRFTQSNHMNFGEMSQYLPKAKVILESQLANTYLLSDISLLRLWLNTQNNLFELLEIIDAGDVDRYDPIYTKVRENMIELSRESVLVLKQTSKK